MMLDLLICVTGALAVVHFVPVIRHALILTRTVTFSMISVALTDVSSQYVFAIRAAV